MIVSPHERVIEVDRTSINAILSAIIDKSVRYNICYGLFPLLYLMQQSILFLASNNLCCVEVLLSTEANEWKIKYHYLLSIKMESQTKLFN